MHRGEEMPLTTPRHRHGRGADRDEPQGLRRRRRRRCRRAARRDHHRRRPAAPPRGAARAVGRGGDDPGAADDRDDGARLRGARRDERPQDHHALRRPTRTTRRGRRGSSTSTTACAPASADAMASDPGLHSRIVGILKVGLPLVALGMLASLFLVQTDDRLRRRPRLLAGRHRLAGRGAAHHQPDLHRHHPGRGQLPLHRGADRARRGPARAGARSPASPARSRCTTGRWSGSRPTTGDLHIPTQRLDVAGNVRLRTSDGYRINAEQATLDLRAGSIVAGNTVETTGPLGRIDSGSLTVQPAAASGEARRFSFANGVRLIYEPPDSK